MNEYHKISEGILGEDTIDKTNTQLFLELVGQYFPEAIKDGEVDFTALKEEMGEFPEVKSEHYEFTWAGKQAAKKEAQADIFGKTLKYKPQDSLNSDTTENIYIEGDNLEALKLLRRNYHGKIKMIYIDPPYNTGNDFVYRDNFTMTEEELSELSKDTIDGIRYQKNPKDCAQFHTKWLNEMYPRLKVAKELLSDDGVIFISIDGHELETLQTVCNEIFSKTNNLGIIVLQTATDNNPTQINEEHEYMICYAKSKNLLNAWYRLSDAAEAIQNKYIKLKQNENDIEKIQVELRKWINANKNSVNQVSHYNCVDKKGVYSASSNSSNPHPGGYMYDIIHYKTKKACPKPANGWRWPEKTFLKFVEEGEVHWGKDHTTQPHIKKRLETVREQLKSVIYEDNRAETKMLTDLFDEKKIFDNPKPHKVIERIIDFVVTSDSIILDFFSGSATTAHAVMQLNAEDGGHRKYIMVQLQEETDEKSEAYKAGYKNICEIGKERIRRAAKKIHEDNPEAVFDDGFKVFEVADTNIRWNTVDDEELTLLGEVNYNTDEKDRIDFVNGSNDIDIVYEIMLRQYNISLTTPIEKLSTVSDRTYIFADSVVVCLESEINDELIEKLASIEPTPNKFVLRDSAFSDNIELKDVSFRKLSALIANHQIKEEFNSNHSNYTVEFI